MWATEQPWAIFCCSVGALSFVNVNENPESAAMPHVEIYTDGGCEPNPDPGGYGVVVLHPRKRAEVSGAPTLANCISPTGLQLVSQKFANLASTPPRLCVAALNCIRVHPWLVSRRQLNAQAGRLSSHSFDRCEVAPYGPARLLYESRA
jgi:hypothetical protein